MNVLVSVDMGNVDAGLLELLNLGLSLACQLGSRDFTAQDGPHKIEQGGTEGSAVGAEKRWDSLRRRDRSSVDEDDVAAYAEIWSRAGESNGFRERWTICHEGRGREDACTMELQYGAIDAGGQAEVVGVDDEAGRHCTIVEASWIEGGRRKARSKQCWRGGEERQARTQSANQESLVGREGLEPPTSCL
jgi:hypothetical protein